MPSPFVKGHKLGKGRIKGSKNNPDIASLKVLLEDAFLRNRSAAIAKIDAMFQKASLKDFKWLCELKASIEPKQLRADVNVNYSVEHLLDVVEAAERHSLPSIN